MQEFINVAPDEVVQAVVNAYKTASWDTVHQERREYYAREFPNSSLGVPSPQETYTANFCRSGFLENSEIILEAVREHIMPVIRRTILDPRIKDAAVELRAYKLESGGHFRLHKDDYRAAAGFIWYLSNTWEWDWGGLLLVIDEANIGKAYLPEYNKLVLLDHESGQNAHCVTPVANYALEPRLMLVGFISFTKTPKSMST